MKTNSKSKQRPRQTQARQPGRESAMIPKPVSEKSSQIGSGKLAKKVALITGGDSGIGRAVAIAFAKEGADVVVAYLNEHDDANETRTLVEEQGRRCLTVAGNIGRSAFCRRLVDTTVRKFGRLDVLVNNAAEQHPQKSIEKISDQQLDRTFRTNIYSMFYLTRAALPHLKKGAAIINTSSVTAYRGSPELLDYSATKGAIVTFTRSLSLALADRNIRVNGVAPGPIWTPLIPATFSGAKVETFGSDTPMKRAGQPEEVAPCYVFLASDDSSYVSGHFLHPNGGETINT